MHIDPHHHNHRYHHANSENLSDTITPPLRRKKVSRYWGILSIPAFLLSLGCKFPSGPPTPNPNADSPPPAQAQELTLTYSSKSVSVVRGSALAALTPTLLPDGATAEYSIDPVPPGWLAFDVFTGAISAQAENTADLPAGKVAYTVTATGTGAHDGKSAMAKITVTVAAFGVITYNDTSALVATAGTELSPERTIAEPADAGHASVTYSIAPDLTADTGLAFDPSNGTISGTPTKVAATATDYTVTATGNSGTIYAGATQTTTLSVQVNPAAFTAKYAGRSSSSIFSILNSGTGDGSSPAQAFTFTLATTHTNARLFPLLRIPGVTGSPGILLPTLATYSITPNTLTTNTGLTFDSSTGRIDGNASMKVASSTTYAITVTGKTGTIYAGYEVTVYIRITIT